MRQKNILFSTTFLYIFVFISGTSFAQNTFCDTILIMIDTSKAFHQSHTGFALYDPAKKSMVCEYQSHKYFTPASNTKLYSFFAGKKILGDSLPALKYFVRNDSLFFTGTGDPSFLNLDLEGQHRTYQFLASRKEKLFYVPAQYEGERFGYGWAWDDYSYYFSAEKSAFPIYGNIVRFNYTKENKSLDIVPSYFEQSLLVDTTVTEGSRLYRQQEENRFMFYPSVRPRDFSDDIPFRYSDKLMLELLSDTLKKEVKLLTGVSFDRKKTKMFYSMPSDSLYKRMLQVSDNFMAEHILLMCSSVLSDTLSTDRAIAFVKDSLLADVPDEPVWVDGSGLSRYNLFTPRTMISLLIKINAEVPDSTLFELLPAGGKSGTIRNWYKADKPYIFAKTGTLSNNHCLTGYLITADNKKLLFSFMHNNYPTYSTPVKEAMEKILWKIHETY